MTLTVQCPVCAHYRIGGICDAFPDGIPAAILTADADHANPYPGDHGIRFTPVTAADKPAKGVFMDENVRFDTVIAADTVAADGPSWIEVIPAAEKQRNGHFYFTVTRDDLDTYAASIKENASLIPIDYDHSDTNRGTVAAGWFTGDTQIVEAGGQNPMGETQEHASLWAQVDWTPQARQEIKDGLYKRLSPEFSFEAQDKKTGLLEKAKSLMSSTLTNRPFFKQLAPVTASEFDDDRVAALAEHFDEDPMEIFTVLADSSMPYGDVTYADPGHQKDGKSRYPLDTEDHIRAAWSYINQAKNAGKYSADQLAAIKSKIRAAMKRIGADVTDNGGGKAAETKGEGDMPDLSAYAAALGLPEDADEPTILAAIKDAKEAAARKKPRARTSGTSTADLAVFAEALGLDADVDESTVLAAVRKAAEDSDRVSALEDEHEGLTATAREKLRLEQRVKTIEAERRAERVQRILLDGVRNGQVLPAEKTALAKAFAENPDGLVEIINTRPVRSWVEQGSGEGLEDSVDVRTAKASFASEEADGIDEDSVRLHVRAEQWLAERGKKPGTYTAAEYAQACDAVYGERVAY